MPTDILISSDPWENRVAILEEGRLAEIYVEREERVIGSIYKGKVVNVLPGMGASFVDIGPVSYTHLTLPTSDLV